MTTTTTDTTIDLAHLGTFATRHCLDAFVALLSNACDEDDRVHSYGAHRCGDHAYLTITGKVTAKELSDEVHAGKHGAW